MEDNTIITIDGPTGSGKSTVGRILAERIGFTYLDSGAMYRVVALEVQRRAVDPDDNASLSHLCGQLDISFRQEDGQRVYSHGVDVTRDIRTPEISMLASRISAKKCVRDALLRLQREIGRQGRIVVDGRDAGTVIFPQASAKFYLDATDEVRSQRRYKELIDKNIKVAYSDVHRDMIRRDRDDRTRAIAPLKPAPDAAIIDTTRMTIEDVVSALVKTIDAKRTSMP